MVVEVHIDKRDEVKVETESRRGTCFKVQIDELILYMDRQTLEYLVEHGTDALNNTSKFWEAV